MKQRSTGPVSSLACLAACVCGGWLFEPGDALPGENGDKHAVQQQPTADQSGSAVGDRTQAVDLRPVFRQRGLAVRDQGTRGTCSVFTVTRALEFALSAQRSHTDRLSVEYLNWASNRAIGKSKDGGFFADLWTGYQQYGICDEKYMPYESQFDPQRQPSQEARRQARQQRGVSLQLNWIKPWDPHRGLTDEQFLAIRETLRGGHPVCGGFLWPKRAQWVDGVLQMATRDNVRDGHSVLLVGFRDDASQPGGGLFWIQNTSAGPRDGALSYEYVLAYMNDAAWVQAVADAGAQ